MGREFVELFEEWAHHYDDTVSGNDKEYEDVFEHYDKILQTVADRAVGTVLEFGVGTGNLTEQLLRRNLSVYGVEPSEQMRMKAQTKFPDLNISDGDFLKFSTELHSIDTIVSTYAFHHLTDEEKGEAMALYSQLLPAGGKIVFADTLYKDQAAKEAIFKDTKDKGFLNLLNDLETEYYPLQDTLQKLFKEHHFDVTFTQLNTFVWLIEAVRKEK